MKSIKPIILGGLICVLVSLDAAADTDVVVDGSLSEWPTDGFTFTDDDEMDSIFNHREILETWITDNNTAGDDGFLFVAIEFQSAFKEEGNGYNTDVILKFDINNDGDFDDPEDRIIEVTENEIYDGTGTLLSTGDIEWDYKSRYLEIAIPYSILGLEYNEDIFGFASETVGMPGFTDFSPEPGADPIVYDGTSGIEPLAVRLLSTSASVSRKGVTVSWTTATERKNAGFHLFRQEPSGDWTRVTTRMIPGLVDAPFGKTYRFIDPAGAPGDAYKIVDHELGGKTTLHEPVIAVEASLAGRTISSRAKKNLREPLPRALPTAFESIPSLDALKMKLDSTGLYRVTMDHLDSGGLDVDGLEPADIRISVGDDPVAVHRDDEGIWFLWRPTVDRYAEHDVAVARDAAALSMKKKKVKGLCSSPVDHLWQHKTMEEDLLYYVASPIEDPIFWAMAFAGYDASFPFDIDEVADVDAEVTVHIAGLSFLDEQDHAVSLGINGTPLGSWEWSGNEVVGLTASVPYEYLLEGDNTLSVSLPVGSTDVVVVDRIDVGYGRLPVAGPDGIAFELSGMECARIGGLDPDFMVFELADGAPPRLVEGYDVFDSFGGTTGISIARKRRDGKSGTSRFMVANRGSATIPTTLGAPREVTAGPSSYVVITHPSMLSAASQMATYHEGTGKTVAVVTTEEIYDTFGSGRPHPLPIRDFLENARSTWATPPEHVLLLGGSTVDSNGHLGTGAVDYVPAPFHVSTTSGYEAVSDGWYVGQDGAQAPWASIGRIAARTPDEADDTVSKLIAWYESAQPATGNGLFVADRDPATVTGDNPFELAASEVMDSCVGSGLDVERMDLDTVPSASTGLVDEMTAGLDVVSFHGHAYVSGWSNPEVLDTDGATSLANDHLFVALSWSCFDGSFVGPWAESLSWELVANPDGGAYAAVSSSSLTEPFAADILAHEIVCLLASSGCATMGEALRQAKEALAGADDELNDVLATYNLLGDPAAPNPWTAF